MAGIRTNILANLRTDLALINGAGSYTNTISTVLKDVRALKDITESQFDAARESTGERNIAERIYWREEYSTVDSSCSRGNIL
jgi:hypothetical protein